MPDRALSMTPALFSEEFFDKSVDGYHLNLILMLMMW